VLRRIAFREYPNTSRIGPIQIPLTARCSWRHSALAERLFCATRTLQLRDGSAAAAAFQQILDHPRLMRDCVVGALAHETDGHQSD